MQPTKKAKGAPKRASNPMKKAKHQRSFYRLAAKKDRRVKRSSRGRFASVAELDAHRQRKEQERAVTRRVTAQPTGA